MNSLLMKFFFIFSAILIMTGVFFNAKFILNKGRNGFVLSKFWVVTMKYLGLAMLGYLSYVCPKDKLILNLSIFIATYFTSFLLFLLARKFSLR